MKILIDIVHPADVNFYKNAVDMLKKDNKIIFTVLERGVLIDIMRREYPHMQIIPLGRHRTGRLSKIIGLIDRETKFLKLLRKEKFDRVTSFGFYPAIAAKFFGIKSTLFYDDFEYKFIFNMCKKFGDTFVIPDSIDISSKNIVKFKGFKELSYINKFEPNKKAIEKFGVKQDRYIFVRDIDKISLNYKNYTNIDYSAIFKDILKKGYTILYYGENKDMNNKYSKYCKILKGPISDIHSLIFFAAFTISSGDTIARESALLGTPVIYTGKRDMTVNNELISMGALMEADSELTVKTLAESNLIKKSKSKIRKEIMKNIRDKWDDTAEVIVREILK